MVSAFAYFPSGNFAERAREVRGLMKDGQCNMGTGVMTKSLPGWKFTRRWALLTGMAAAVGGCAYPLIRGQSPDVETVEDQEETGPALVGEFASPWGIKWMRVQNVALVNSLDNTGSDPISSPQRSELITAMKTLSAHKPEQILASPRTSMVIVTAYLPPGVQKYQEVDLHVQTRSNSKTESLRGGYLMPTRLKQMEVHGNVIRKGHGTAKAAGHILVDSIFDGEDDPRNLTRGRILGGGKALYARPLGLQIREDFKSIRASTRVAKAVNLRFQMNGYGRKTGVANPKTNRVIELSIPAEYRHNIGRYLRVVRAIAVSESPSERIERIEKLGRQLRDPELAAQAALKLEAIGSEGQRALLTGLTAPSFESRFYSAEALAFLDNVAAVPVLTEAALTSSALRWHALSALVAMTHVESNEALVELMNGTSAETRYGAFRAIRQRNPNDPLIRGRSMGDFSLHVVESALGDQMIHFSRSRAAEILILGRDVRIEPREFLYAGKHILIKPLPNGRLRVNRFYAVRDDVRRECSTRLDDLIETIVEVGGDYSDVLDAVRSAKEKGILPARLAIDAVPLPGREYRGQNAPKTPLPDMFQTREHQSKEDIEDEKEDYGDQPDFVEVPSRGFFDRLTWWMLP